MKARLADVLAAWIPAGVGSAGSLWLDASAMDAMLAAYAAVAREVRKTHQVPVLLFGYYNPVLSYGEVKLANDALAVPSETEMTMPA